MPQHYSQQSVAQARFLLSAKGDSEVLLRCAAQLGRLNAKVGAKLTAEVMEILEAESVRDLGHRLAGCQQLIFRALQFPCDQVPMRREPRRTLKAAREMKRAQMCLGREIV